MEKLCRLSSVGSEILVFSSHCLANFQSSFDCFMSNFQVKYDDSENIKTDPVNTVAFNLTSNQTEELFLEHLVNYWEATNGLYNITLE